MSNTSATFEEMTGFVHFEVKPAFLARWSCSESNRCFFRRGLPWKHWDVLLGLYTASIVPRNAKNTQQNLKHRAFTCLSFCYSRHRIRNWLITTSFHSQGLQLLLANVYLEPWMIIPLPYNFRTWPALHLSISAKELWHTGSLFWSLVSLTEKHKHGLGCICDCFSNKDVAPTSSISKFLDLQQLWFLTKGIQHLKFISQMWVNSLKALNVHLQSSTIKAFWHSMHVYVSIPFLVSFAGEPVKISIVFLIWSSFSFRLILWMFSIYLIWSGLLHWQLVFNNDITHSRVTTPVAAPTTAPATATAPASAVSGRSSGIGGGILGLHLALPPQTTPQTPSPGLSPLSHLQQPKTGGKFCIIKAHRLQCHSHLLTSFNRLYGFTVPPSPHPVAAGSVEHHAGNGQSPVSKAVLWESQRNATKNARNQ